MIIGIFLSTISIYTGILILINKPDKENLIYPFTASTFFIFPLILITRIIVWVVFPSSRELFNQSYINYLLFLSSLIIDISWTMLFFILYNQTIILKLYHSEKRFKNLSSIATESIMIHDQGIIVDVNNAFLNLLGYKNSSEVIGKNRFDIIPLTLASKQTVLEHLITNVDQTFDVEIIKSNGQIINLETKGEDIIYNERNARLVFLRDITR